MLVIIVIIVVLVVLHRRRDHRPTMMSVTNPNLLQVAALQRPRPSSFEATSAAYYDEERPRASSSWATAPQYHPSDNSPPTKVASLDERPRPSVAAANASEFWQFALPEADMPLDNGLNDRARARSTSTWATSAEFYSNMQPADSSVEGSSGVAYPLERPRPSLALVNSPEYWHVQGEGEGREGLKSSDGEGAGNGSAATIRPRLTATWANSAEYHGNSTVLPLPTQGELHQRPALNIRPRPSTSAATSSEYWTPTHDEDIPALQEGEARPRLNSAWANSADYWPGESNADNTHTDYEGHVVIESPHALGAAIDQQANDVIGNTPDPTGTDVRSDTIIPLML